MKHVLAVYAGSFDPPTFGHFDLIVRASKVFSEVIIAIGRHATKKPLFSLEERVGMLREITQGIDNVRIDFFDGLLIQYCEKVGARVIVRGLRAASDFEYELQIAHANADMSPQIDTVFLPTRTQYTFISASLIREIASHGGDVSHYAPAVVCEALKAKFGKADKGA
ncbi:MAG: pantetheine-phosphate adenylyltransferase [Polyangiaceae bacterium]